MVLLEYMLFRGPGCRDRILGRLGNCKKFRILEQLPADQRHVSGAGIMIRIMESIRIDKIRIFSAQLLTYPVHFFYKPGIIMAAGCSHIFTYGIGDFVCGCQKRCVQCLLQCELIAFFHSYR